MNSGSGLDIDAIPLALYVHFPWCERKCPYCDFNSHEQFKPAEQSDYIDALLNDLKQQLGSLYQRPLHSIFLGGGTPSLFSGDSIERLLGAIDKRWGIGRDVEVTMEANPGSAEADRFRSYRNAGVNRLSLGIQSFANRHLKALGRIHDRDQAIRAIEAARLNFDRINLDIMHGLSGQTTAEALEDLAMAVDRAEGHISWYQLTIEPNTAFWSKPPSLPGDDSLADIQDAGEAYLRQSGFDQYEVSAWARPGQQSSHNLNYWTFGDYLGIGAGAHGKITRPGGEVIRKQRSRLPKDYMAAIDDNKPPLQQVIPGDQLPVEFMLNALRLRGGVNEQLYRARTGLDATDIAGIRSELVSEGLLSDAPDRLAVTPLGFRFLDDVVARFMNP
ncbi:MAG: radical SAM family heme chaperone HemW [Luminiphilus sp.]